MYAAAVSLGYVLYITGTALWLATTAFELMPPFMVNGEGLLINGAIYGRFIPKESIIIGDSRIVNLNVEGELRPVRRTNGIGLPGLSEGWFRLANGERALMFVTDRDSVVYMPTREGYSVLLSTVNAEEFLESLAEEWNGV